MTRDVKTGAREKLLEKIKQQLWAHVHEMS